MAYCAWCEMRKCRARKTSDMHEDGIAGSDQLFASDFPTSAIFPRFIILWNE